MNSSNVYKLTLYHTKQVVLAFRSQFYDKRKSKNIQYWLLNSPYNIRYYYLVGYYAEGGTQSRCLSFDNKRQIGASKLNFFAILFG